MSMPKIQVIKVPAATINHIQALIDSDKQYEGCGQYDIIQTFTAIFDDGIEADIKVCNGGSGPWIDPVLFHDGAEVCVLEPEYHLAGEYVFEYDGRTYIVSVQAETDRLEITDDTVTVYDQDGEVVRWTADEWLEDPQTVVPVMLNAVRLYYEKGAGEIRKIINK